MALLYYPDDTLRKFYVYCDNCFPRINGEFAKCDKLNLFVMLYPRYGEGVTSKSQCFRILGTINDAEIGDRAIRFWVNLTPTLPKDQRLAYQVELRSVAGINDGLDRPGDVVARIINDPTGQLNCGSQYYDFYYFGLWSEIPKVVWADSWMEMSALHWQHAQLMRAGRR